MALMQPFGMVKVTFVAKNNNVMAYCHIYTFRTRTLPTANTTVSNSNVRQ